MKKETREIRLKRLRYRSMHRGCKETDALLGFFSERHLPALDDAALAVYERFLDESDHDIWDWVAGKSVSAHREYALILDALKNMNGSTPHPNPLPAKAGRGD